MSGLVCDFCKGHYDESTGSRLAGIDMDIVAERAGKVLGGISYRGDWAACKRCARLASSGQWVELLFVSLDAMGAREMPKDMRDFLIDGLCQLYSAQWGVDWDEAQAAYMARGGPLASMPVSSAVN